MAFFYFIVHILQALNEFNWIALWNVALKIIGTQWSDSLMVLGSLLHLFLDLISVLIMWSFNHWWIWIDSYSQKSYCGINMYFYFQYGDRTSSAKIESFWIRQNFKSLLKFTFIWLGYLEPWLSIEDRDMKEFFLVLGSKPFIWHCVQACSLSVFQTEMGNFFRYY